MKFSEVIGHQSIKRHLINMVKENRVSHAQMYHGVEGTGKILLAIAFAQYLNCKNRQADDSCGECSSCKKFEKLIHPDLHFVFPVVKSATTKAAVSDSFINEWRQIVVEKKYFSLQDWYKKIGAEKGQGLIYSQESQEVLKKLSLKTFEADFKVMIIWMPEMMHQSAANKLLKLLEEPPAGTVFVLVSDKPGEVLGTILSRTQQLKVGGLPTEEIALALQKEYSLPSTDSIELAKLSNGSYVAAKEIVEESEDRAYFFDKFVALMRLAYGRKLHELITWCDEIATQSRERQKNFFNYALRLIRENFVMNMQEEDLLYLTPEEKGFSAKFSPFINDDNVWNLAEEFSLAHSHIEQNGNAKIIFMDVCLKVIILLKQ